MTLPIEYIFPARTTVTVCLIIVFAIDTFECVNTVHLLEFPISVVCPKVRLTAPSYISMMF